MWYDFGYSSDEVAFRVTRFGHTRLGKVDAGDRTSQYPAKTRKRAPCFTPRLTTLCRRQPFEHNHLMPRLWPGLEPADHPLMPKTDRCCGKVPGNEFHNGAVWIAKKTDLHRVGPGAREVFLAQRGLPNVGIGHRPKAFDHAVVVALESDQEGPLKWRVTRPLTLETGLELDEFQKPDPGVHRISKVGLVNAAGTHTHQGRKRRLKLIVGDNRQPDALAIEGRLASRLRHAMAELMSRLTATIIVPVGVSCKRYPTRR